MTTSQAIDDQPAAARSSGPLAVTSWMLFDWAAQPFYTLITTFLFAPYFTSVFVGDAARGGAIWGYAMAFAAILIALGSPVLGAIADKSGGLKRIIAILSIGFVLGQAALWFAMPGGASDMLWPILFALVIATVSAEFSAVMNNSLMPRLVTRDQLGRVSGGGWAMGYIGGLISLIFMAAFVLTDGPGQTLLGLDPLFPFDAETHEASRFVGPFAALWFIIFVIPFFLFTPDAPPRAGAASVSLGLAFRSVKNTLSHIRRYRDLALFFLARMLFIDGLLAIFTFGGIYAQSVFGWPLLVVGYFGIILSAAAGIGAAIGGFVDDRLGSKNVLVGSLLLLITGALGVISIDSGHVLFVLEVQPRGEGSPAFSTVGELAYMGFAVLIGLSAGPLQSASRSLLARMAPPEHMSEFFGFFAFSGKVTAFAAPLTIGIVSDATGSLQIAMSTILVFLFLGLAVLSFVRTSPSGKAAH